MKVHDLREKYGFGMRYASDEYFFKKYPDAEVLAWAAAICTNAKGDERAYAYACVFRSARLLVGFVNGRRADVQDAYRFCKKIRVEQYEHPNAAKEVFMEAV